MYAGIAGSIFFVVTFAIQAILREGYSSLKYPVSSLSLGPWGWIQVLNFLITGFLILLYSVGLFRLLKEQSAGRWASLLIGLAGLGLVGAGIFSTDAVFGYPENAPLRLAQFSIHGLLHNAVSFLVFFGLPAACLCMRKFFSLAHEKLWAIYSVFTSVVMLFTFFFSGISFERLTGLWELAGLFQRVSIISGWSWMAAIAFYFLGHKTDSAYKEVY